MENDQSLQQEATTAFSQAQTLALAIRDQDSYANAATFLLQIKSVRRKVEEFFGPMVKSAHKTWKESVALRQKADDPLDRAESVLKPALSRYLEEEEKKRLAIQRKAQEAADKLEQEARLHAAIDAEKDGDATRAEEILDTPAPVAPVLIPKADAVAGISTRETWKCEVTNIRELAAGILRGEVPITAIEPNMTVIGQAARAMKTEFKWPGVHTWKEQTIVGRGQ